MSKFDYGPVEFVTIGFDGKSPTADVGQALEELADTKTIRILDLALVTTHADGTIEIRDAPGDPDLEIFSRIETEASGLAAEEDLTTLSTAIPAGNSAVVLLLEMLWAKDLASSLASSGGFVIHADRIPAVVVNAALADLNAPQ